MKARIGQPLKSVLGRKECLRVGSQYARMECGYAYARDALTRGSADADVVRTGLKTAEVQLEVMMKEHGPLPKGTKNLAKKTAAIINELRNKTAIEPESAPGLKERIDALWKGARRIWEDAEGRCG